MQVVLLGEVGSGRTTLFNRITESDEKTSRYETSTINVTSKLSAYGHPKFNVLDTPGFGTSQKKIVHIAGIITALTECPVNRIIVTVRFERIDKVVKQFDEVLKHIDTYAHLITIVVTSWDLSHNSEREGFEKELREIFQRKFNQTSIILTSKKESGNETCQKIITEIANSKAEQIIITPEIVFQKFQVYVMSEDKVDELNALDCELATKTLRIFRSARQIYNQFLEKKKEADISSIYFEVKQIALKTLDEFEIENYMIFCELEFLGKMIVHNRFKKIILKQLENFILLFKNNFLDSETELRKIRQDEIVCQSETTQKWQDQVVKCQKQYQLIIEEEIEKQKFQRIRL